MFTNYSEEVIEDVRINSDIVDIISEYVKLDKRGKNYFGLCPFHKEDTASFSVEPNKQIYYCFGCGKGGNVFHFIMNYENIDFIEAVKLLAERAGILLPESNDDKEKETAKLKAELYKINVETARFYNRCLFSDIGKEGQAYFTKRGLSTSVIKKFGLGYAPAGNRLLSHLKQKGFSDDIIQKSGLFNISKEGKLYDRFRNRVMFPIFDVRGNVIAFGGRVLDNSLPKYVNSPETLIYNKRRHLYGLNIAKSSQEKNLIVVEGYMDAITLHQYGIDNVVASLGTALTDNQCKLLKKYSNEVLISYDSDTAGQAATLRGLELLSSLSCDVRVITFGGEAKDPDEFIRKKGRDSYREKIKKAVPLTEYKISLIEVKNDGDEKSVIDFLDKATDYLVSLKNNIEREVYIKKLSKDHGISIEAINAEIIRKSKRKASIDNKKQFEERNRLVPSSHGKYSYNSTLHDELFILSIISSDNNVYYNLKSRINSGIFTDERVKIIAKEVLERLDDNNDISQAEFLNYIHDNDLFSIVTRIINTEDFCENNEEAVLQKLDILKKKKMLSRQQEIIDSLKDTNISAEERQKLTVELNEIIIKLKK